MASGGGAARQGAGWGAEGSVLSGCAKCRSPEAECWGCRAAAPAATAAAAAAEPAESVGGDVPLRPGARPRLSRLRGLRESVPSVALPCCRPRREAAAPACVSGRGGSVVARRR